MDRETYRALGIKSHVEIPLNADGALLGALMFSSLGAERVWPDELVQRLQLLAEVFANILSRRQSDMELQQLRQDLAHVGRVSTVGELTASLAHELNQPLTAILSNAEAAQDVLDVTPTNLPELREILADIVDDDRRAVEVIHRLRGLLKKGQLELAPLDANEVVREVARLVGGDAVLRDVLVRLELADRLPPAHGDRVQVQQVILNLILNGLQAMAESARRRPGSRPPDRRGRRLGRPHRGARLRDRGRRVRSGTHLRGIPHDQVVRDGNGAGDLAVRRRGSRRPSHRAEQSQRRRDVLLHPARRAAATVTSSEEARVFLVDDDASVRKSVTRLLRGAGYAVEPFVSAREFLSRPAWGGPSCLVLDVRMPGLTGLDLQEALVAAGRRLSIVFITGYGDIPASVKAMKGGAIDFLVKPVDKQDLLSAIERARGQGASGRTGRTRGSPRCKDRIRTLTPREAEVFALVVTGMLNKQVGVCPRCQREDGQGASGPRHGQDACRFPRRAGPPGRRRRCGRGTILTARGGTGRPRSTIARP